jgi:Lipocalin-like domain
MYTSLKDQRQRMGQRGPRMLALSQQGNNIMRRRGMLTVITMSLVFLGLVLPAGDALGQIAKDLVGTWTFVSVDSVRPDGTRVQSYGPNPKGLIIFDSKGRFAYLLTRPGRPKFAANSREQGTPEENKATVQGSIGYSGTYSVSDKTLIFKIEAATYPNAEGTEQKRAITTLTGDQLKYSNSTSTMGGTTEAVLKRLK